MAKSGSEPGIDREELRRMAQEAAAGPRAAGQRPSPVGAERLIHELAVYQEELLAQNEELTCPHESVQVKC